MWEFFFQFFIIKFQNTNVWLELFVCWIILENRKTYFIDIGIDALQVVTNLSYEYVSCIVIAVDDDDPVWRKDNADIILDTESVEPDNLLTSLLYHFKRAMHYMSPLYECISFNGQLSLNMKFS